MLSSRQAPTLIFCMPLRPVGNRAACQPNKRSSVSGSLIFLGGVEHHLDDAFDVPVGRRQCPDIEPEAAGDGGAHLVDVEDLALDLARFQDILGQGVEDGLLAEPEAEAFHPADQPALPVTHGRELVRQPFLIPVEPGPIASLVDVHCYSPHRLRR